MQRNTLAVNTRLMDSIRQPNTLSWKPLSPAEHPVSRSAWVTFTVLLIVIAGFGAVFTLFWGAVSVMASDTCTSGDTRAICTAEGQQLVFLSPWIGWITGLLVSLAGAGLSVRLRGSPLIGLLIGVLAYLMTMVIVGSMTP